MHDLILSGVPWCESEQQDMHYWDNIKRDLIADINRKFGIYRRRHLRRHQVCRLKAKPQG